MVNNDQPAEETIIDGLIITAFLDQGPVNVYNSSPFHNNDAYNFVIWELPAFNIDLPMTLGEILPTGLFTTKCGAFRVLTYFLYLPVEFSSDPRIKENGRPIIFWVFSQSETILNVETKIEQKFIQLFRYHKILNDIDLIKTVVMQDIDDKIKQITKNS